MKVTNAFMLFLCAFVLTTAGCTGSSDDAPDGAHAAEADAAPTNRVDIPASVRTNLGITFAKAERRSVADTIRVPGRFELMPSARRELRTPLSGRIDLLVEQFQPVEPGTPIYRLDAPEWRALQREIEDTSAQIEVAKAGVNSIEPIMEAHRLHEAGLREAVDLWANRVQQLNEVAAAGGGRAAELADAQSKLTESRAAFGEVREKDAELALRRSEIESALRTAESRLTLLLGTAGALLGATPDQLNQRNDPQSLPLWKTADTIEVKAGRSGVVEVIAMTNGAWSEQGELVLAIVDATAVRFRAVGLQSDIGRLETGMPASIVPPQGGSIELDDAIAAELQIGLSADARQRTIDLYATPSRIAAWARPGISAFLEIDVKQSAPNELAIPLSSVVRDGLKPIIFRRDPANPEKVIRMDADLGMNDGRWVIIKSGVREGDEIVLDGAYQLLLASGSGIQKGGHFHSDGTFHDSDKE